MNTYLIIIPSNIHLSSIPIPPQANFPLFKTVREVFFCEVVYDACRFFFHRFNGLKYCFLQYKFWFWGTDKSHMVPGKADDLRLGCYIWLETSWWTNRIILMKNPWVFFWFFSRIWARTSNYRIIILICPFMIF